MTPEGPDLLEFFLIADARTFLAFALTGVRGGVPEGPQEACRMLAQARTDPTVGLILITERLAQEIRGEVDTARRQCSRPLILEIPDQAGPLPTAASLLDRLRILMGIPR
jgi:V/A-type H+-transporting ATPase subunit F